MKKLLSPAAFVLALIGIFSTAQAQNTNLVLDGTSGTNSYTNNYAVSSLNLSLGFFADYLVVGGGGSGGTPGGPVGQAYWGTGGGGGGGVLQGSMQLVSSNYGVTVGAGGHRAGLRQQHCERGQWQQLGFRLHHRARRRWWRRR